VSRRFLDEMEGFLIRVPVEACFPDTRPVWKQRADACGPVRSRVLYYVIEEGYLRGYKSPDDLDEPVEAFQLTSHRIEVNAMYSLNIFEVKARAATLPPAQHFVEDTSSSSSDSSDEDVDASTKQAQPAALYSPQITASTSPVISGSFHVVFFAANKDLVKKWSTKLLNWNRYVFGAADVLDEAGFKLARADIVEALRAVNAADRFLRPVVVEPTPLPDVAISANELPPTGQGSVIPAPIDQPALHNQSPSLTPTETDNVAPLIGATDVVKPTDSVEQSSPWWVVPFGRSRKVSSYSLRR
jgi:hypothetical protein